MLARLLFSLQVKSCAMLCWLADDRNSQLEEILSIEVWHTCHAQNIFDTHDISSTKDNSQHCSVATRREKSLRDSAFVRCRESLREKSLFCRDSWGFLGL